LKSLKQEKKNYLIHSTEGAAAREETWTRAWQPWAKIKTFRIRGCVRCGWGVRL
jgi:hypothetical protein